MSQPSPDARAVVRALEGLTTQVRRLADTQQSDFVLSDDATADDDATTDDDALRRMLTDALTAEHYRRAREQIAASPEEHSAGMADVAMGVVSICRAAEAKTPATTCSARYTGVLPVGECIRAAGHSPATDHTDDRGRNFGDSSAEYPTDSTVRVAHWHPVSEQSAEERQELAGMVGEFIDAQQRSATPGPDFTSPLTSIEVRVPCPYCPPHAMIPRTLITDHIAREHHPGLAYPPNLATAEDAHRIARRRDSILNLLSRIDRGNDLTPEERTLLRRHVQTEGAERDNLASSYITLTRLFQQIGAGRATWKAKAEEMERDRDRVAAERDSADRIRAEAQRDRDQHAAVLAEVLRQFTEKGHPGAPCLRSSWVREDTVARWRSVVAPTVERPWWVDVAEIRAELEETLAAIERVRAHATDAKTRYAHGRNDYEIGKHDLAGTILGALDSTQPTTEA